MKKKCKIQPSELPYIFQLKAENIVKRIENGFDVNGTKFEWNDHPDIPKEILESELKFELWYKNEISNMDVNDIELEIPEIQRAINRIEAHVKKISNSSWYIDENGNLITD